MDGEFAPLKPLIAEMPIGPHVKLTSTNEHVPDIERRIRVVKETSCATRHGLPLQRIPQLMVIHMVILVVKMLSYFSSKGGVSIHMSPKKIMSGKTLDYKKHLSLSFGNYCQVHEEETLCNSQIAPLVRAI